MSKKQLGKTSWKDYTAQQQLQGVIPARVAVFPPEVEGKHKSKKGVWTFPLVLLAIVAGVPFFKGGGSLAAAGLPGLAAIAPDAVDLAIRNNPQWSAGTRLRLIGVAVAMNATPTVALTGLFGFQQNSAASLWFIPIYWAETLGTRDWQIKTLADMIADNENHPSVPK
ncbi:MAG TPA: hypothetical protein VKI44_34850 [Acetobacteraceae bacterium]|nr:hypothetical protein [Acetobacteraceae bacterium]